MSGDGHWLGEGGRGGSRVRFRLWVWLLLDLSLFHLGILRPSGSSRRLELSLLGFERGGPERGKVDGRGRWREGRRCRYEGHEQEKEKKEKHNEGERKKKKRKKEEQPRALFSTQFQIPLFFAPNRPTSRFLVHGLRSSQPS